MFGHDHSNEPTATELPVWDESLQQKLLFELCDAGRTTVRGFGAPGLAALEQKAAEIHRTATEGIDDGMLVADLEQTTWDAAETLAWLHRADPEKSALLPHREADGVVPDRDEIRGAGFWQLQSGDFVRCDQYDSVALRREIAAGVDVFGQFLSADEMIPEAGLRLALAAVDYLWTVQGRATQRARERAHS